MRATAARERPACPPPPPGHALRWAQGQLAELEREMYVGGRMPPEAYIHAAAPAPSPTAIPRRSLFILAFSLTATMLCPTCDTYMPSV